MSIVPDDNQESMSQVANLLSREAGLTFIEQLQIVSTKPCTKLNTPYLIGTNVNEQKTVLSKAACKMWDCETCGARNTRSWIACLLNGYSQLAFPLSFLTLTSHRRKRKKSSVACLRQGWKKLYNRILAKLKKSGENLYFCRIWEQHKDGSFHLHVLISCNFGTRWAKNNARACGMGHQADWRNVDNAGMAVGYVAKYSLKNSTIARGGVKWPKGLRRIEVSRNWPKLPEMDTMSGYKWSITTEREHQLHVACNLAYMGYQVIDMVP